MFWEAIEYLHRWEREHLPGADTPQGSEVLIWLLKSQNQAKPLKDLYRSSRYSEPTIRACLRGFVEQGFVVIESHGHDMRTRFARVTPKLEASVRAYRQRFQEVAALADRHEMLLTRGPLPLEVPSPVSGPPAPHHQTVSALGGSRAR
jgi:DNA-binding MarR family transcriptional regulator